MLGNQSLRVGLRAGYYNRAGKDTSKGRAFAVGEVEWGKQMLGCLWGCVRRWESAYKANGVGRGHYGVSGWGAV